jgi:hypothetical protein
MERAFSIRQFSNGRCVLSLWRGSTSAFFNHNPLRRSRDHATLSKNLAKAEVKVEFRIVKIQADCTTMRTVSRGHLRYCRFQIAARLGKNFTLELFDETSRVLGS